MEEDLTQAREELKRLEHIIYVSLKYTRTVDVIINALRRMVSTCDSIFLAFIEKAIEEGKMDSIAASPALRATRIAKLHEEDEIFQKYYTFYAFLKTILKLPYSRREEYRRHVTHIVELPNATSEACIDSLQNCETFLHNFFSYAWKTLMGTDEEQDDL